MAIMTAAAIASTTSAVAIITTAGRRYHGTPTAATAGRDSRSVSASGRTAVTPALSPSSGYS
ncbi:MAG TPA: hypothetical protein VIO95_05990, partial [Mycobacterium sp.]